MTEHFLDIFIANYCQLLFDLLHVLLKKGQIVNKLDISQLEISDEIDEVCI